jgi:hypothetical protein
VLRRRHQLHEEAGGEAEGRQAHLSAMMTLSR